MSEEVVISELMQSSGVAFGTSGARGTVAAMDDRVCYAYTRAFIQALELENHIQSGDDIVLSGDLRSSTPRILAAVAQAVVDAGYKVNHVGRLPSPALAYYAMQNNNASIMVTGSHIPDDRNGIKFNRPDGEILKQDEQAIKQQTVIIPQTFMRAASDLPVNINSAAEKLYKSRYLEFYPQSCLRGMHVGVYQHSGVGRDILADVLQTMGAKVKRLARSEAFIPVDTEAIREEDIRLAQQWSDEYKLDAIVSTDGDADRPLIADENGIWLRGDIVGVLCAHFLGADSVVTPVSSNTVVESCGWFERVCRTRIGSPYVIAQMNELINKDNIVVGYEANGGVLLASDINNNNRHLKALPTRDALLPILSILVAAMQQGQSISELLALLPERYTASGRLKDFPANKARDRIRLLAENNQEINNTFACCCGNIRDIDTTDGLRMQFTNDEIIHLRPSGNAPELRCYNEASTMERAKQLNELCLQIISAWR
jgi:phosphomannomutase